MDPRTQSLNCPDMNNVISQRISGALALTFASLYMQSQQHGSRTLTCQERLECTPQHASGIWNREPRLKLEMRNADRFERKADPLLKTRDGIDTHACQSGHQRRRVTDSTATNTCQRTIVTEENRRRNREKRLKDAADGYACGQNTSPHAEDHLNIVIPCQAEKPWKTPPHLPALDKRQQAFCGSVGVWK